MENFINLYSEVNTFNVDLQNRYVTKDKPRQHKNEFQKSLYTTVKIIHTIFALGDPNGLNEWFERLSKLRVLVDKSKTELALKFPENKINQRLTFQIHEICSIVDNEFYKNIKEHEEHWSVAKSFINLIEEFKHWFDQNFIENELIIETPLNTKNNESNDSENKINSISQIQLINTPFHTQHELDVFMCLNSKWNYKDKVRWTYIYEFLTVELKFKLSQNKFFTFVSENFEDIAKRKQETANDKALGDALKRIYSDDCNKPAIKHE